MVELFLCSLLTIFPDFLFRRFVQGKRIGREITIYTVWYELRYGITACLVLTVALITLIFYFHPASNNVIAAFRTVTILPEKNGRVAEVFVKLNEEVKAGAPLFRLDSSEEEAALETARRRSAEIDAQLQVAKMELAAADGRITQAEAAYMQAQDELNTKTELMKRNADVVTKRELERLKVAADGREGAVREAMASKEVLQTQISSLLPAQKASAEAALAQAQVELDRTVVRAGVTGVVQQFALRAGDVVNPMIRSAGILVPTTDRRIGFIGGFLQIEAQVIKVGMIAEATCAAKPFTIIPMVVTEVQHVIASGQVRPTDQLVDIAQIARPGTITVYLEPLYPGLVDDIPLGSSCIANAYTNNHDELASPDISTGRWLYLHLIDTVGLVHALLLRLQAILLPIQTLVLSGH
ncbi:HlyD family secretion protein [Mesorhizobium sp. IMUNJ 23232]|uniref:HlyD family secretion protein n=1 Tax=Mesorhizobium sp. IMUNJ 23232 TaxID=3376064 RepID=UPI0037BC0EDD